MKDQTIEIKVHQVKQEFERVFNLLGMPLDFIDVHSHETYLAVLGVLSVKGRRFQLPKMNLDDNPTYWALKICLEATPEKL